jgi:hypothetical protein
LVSRSDEFSGNEKLKRFTNQPHREWIYRQAYEMGRHVIGYEVQKVLAGIDCLQELRRNAGTTLLHQESGRSQSLVLAKVD